MGRIKIKRKNTIRHIDRKYKVKAKLFSFFFFFFPCSNFYITSNTANVIIRFRTSVRWGSGEIRSPTEHTRDFQNISKEKARCFKYQRFAQVEKVNTLKGGGRSYRSCLYSIHHEHRLMAKIGLVNLGAVKSCRLNDWFFVPISLYSIPILSSRIPYFSTYLLKFFFLNPLFCQQGVLSVKKKSWQKHRKSKIPKIRQVRWAHSGQHTRALLSKIN